MAVTEDHFLSHFWGRISITCTKDVSLTWLNLQAALSAPALAAVSRLMSLFGMFTVLRDLGDFLEGGYMTGAMAASLREEFYQARPCLALTERIWPVARNVMPGLSSLQTACSGLPAQVLSMHR